MAEKQASKKIDLSEVMLAMDVVDTLRHQQSIVERELQSEDREAELIEKLRKIYADQGLEVSDGVIAEGVKAMREERFAYRPPPGGFKTTLARLYVNRGRWAKRAMWLLIAVMAVWAGYRYLYLMPAEHGRSRLARELKTQVSDQKERIATLKERINAATGELDKALQSVPATVLPQRAGSRRGPGKRWLRPPGNWGPPRNSGRLPESTRTTWKLTQRRSSSVWPNKRESSTAPRTTWKTPRPPPDRSGRWEPNSTISIRCAPRP